MSVDPFRCQITDYFEAAIVLKYQLEVTHNTHGMLFGIAVDMKPIDRKETVIFKTPTREYRLLLDDISHVNVLTPGAQFKTIPYFLG
ncbi:Rho-binding antiterminator [Alteromonas oceanisediminis]|uniref:Rho-binding antiterminator n=1 Tax=Alteromonas oceanisediminis TaxID=2836180 RepID=UPI001BDA2F61|nr:Rho-binding antiterminator [Alteromonas oceanisediminis]MBT0587848.1 hypothetical protein [Alteromonas oceanisediminis]